MKHGYFLIESIVALAIITMAGTMITSYLTSMFSILKTLQNQHYIYAHLYTAIQQDAMSSSLADETSLLSTHLVDTYYLKTYQHNGKTIEWVYVPSALNHE